MNYTNKPDGRRYATKCTLKTVNYLNLYNLCAKPMPFLYYPVLVNRRGLWWT